MAVTRSTSIDRPQLRRGVPGGRRTVQWRTRELAALLAASLLIGLGLHFVKKAKSEDLAGIDSGLAAKQLLNLNSLSAREDLLPALTQIFPQSAELDFAARKIYDLSGSLPNVGAIARIRVTAAEVSHERGLATLRARLGDRVLRRIPQDSQDKQLAMLGGLSERVGVNAGAIA